MKRKIICLLCTLLMVTLVLTTFSACTGKGGKENESSSDTESGTLTGNEHLATESESESVTETEAPTQTEPPTEPPTEAPTDTPTEPPTEKPTETETETETEPPVSLKYISYDNGTCSVSGIGNYTDSYVIIPEKSPNGDIVTAIEDKAFFENTNIKAVQIPSTVMNIGSMAFGGCSSLVYISVDSNNKVYTDVSGILYSKEKTKLLYFPAASQAAEIFISVSVTEIADMAFFSTPYLKKINYGGTLSDWNKIKIGDKNYGIYAASLSFAVTE